jgi:hypothetical protein
LVDLLNGTWTYLKLDVVAMPLFTWYLCQVITLTNNQIHLKVVTTIVTLIKSVEYGAQKWISWKLTLMLGT